MTDSHLNNRRTDYYTALLIDSVLKERARLGINLTARSLSDLGIPLEVAMRLLTRPWERRTYPSSGEDIQMV
jgi:hypothetical protein